MAKQDRVYTRTAADLERKQSVRKSFNQVMGIANDARDVARNAIEEAGEPADSIDIGSADRLVFSSYEELNAYVEDAVRKMEMDTQKIVGATFDFDLFGYGTITFAVGLDGNGEPNALVSMLVDGQHLYRMGASDGVGEDGTRQWFWFKRNGSIDNGEWSVFGASVLGA